MRNLSWAKVFLRECLEEYFQLVTARCAEGLLPGTPVGTTSC
jgi:hypothetical protein